MFDLIRENNYLVFLALIIPQAVLLILLAMKMYPIEGGSGDSAPARRKRR